MSLTLSHNSHTVTHIHTSIRSNIVIYTNIQNLHYTLHLDETNVFKLNYFVMHKAQM
jgi:hypothetical protein